MKMESVKYTITCMILLLSSFVSSDRYSRLDKRINIIEEKVHFDATTFREDIADIFEMLDELLDKMPGDETFSEKAGSQTKYDTKEIDKALQVIKRAVQVEKKHIRKIIKETQTEISQHFSQQVNLTDTLRADLSDKVENISSSLKVLQALIDKSKDEIHATQSTCSDTQHDIAYVNTRLERTTVETENVSKNVMQLNEKYDFLSKTIDCHNNFGYSFGNSCYFVEKDVLLTWAQANEKCVNDGAYLTEIDNEEENTFLIKLASKLTPKDQLYGVWIGGSDLDYDGVWVWQKSKRLIYSTYSNFKGSEPNGKTQENCLHLIRKYYWNWNDYLCDTPLSYICERTL